VAYSIRHHRLRLSGVGPRWFQLEEQTLLEGINPMKFREQQARKFMLCFRYRKEILGVFNFLAKPFLPWADGYSPSSHLESKTSQQV
jgi:hypothetical protein